MSDPKPNEEPVAVPISWVGLDEAPIAFSNQAMAQLDDRGDVILTFGVASPPVIFGTDAERMEQMRAVPFIAVRPVARVAMGRNRLVDLIRALQETQANLEKLAVAEGKREDGPR
jgi:hypothetical protein